MVGLSLKQMTYLIYSEKEHKLPKGDIYKIEIQNLTQTGMIGFL